MPREFECERRPLCGQGKAGTWGTRDQPVDQQSQSTDMAMAVYGGALGSAGRSVLRYDAHPMIYGVAKALVGVLVTKMGALDLHGMSQLLA